MRARHVLLVLLMGAGPASAQVPGATTPADQAPVTTLTATVTEAPAEEAPAIDPGTSVPAATETAGEPTAPAQVPSPDAPDLGWLQPAGATRLVLTAQVLAGSRAHGIDGTRLDLGQTYQDAALRLRFEHGIDDRITALVDATPLGIARFGDETTAYAGLIGVGARLGLVPGTLPLDLELRYGYAPPLGIAAVGAGVAGGQAYRFQPALERHLGSGALQLGLVQGALWGRASAGVVFQSGEGQGPAFEGVLRIGYLAEAVDIRADLGATAHLSFGDPTVVDVSGLADARSLRLDLGLTYALTRGVGLRVEAGVPLYAEAVAAAPSLGLGVELRP